MSSLPAGKRAWNCPDCGGEVLLSITQLDPLACPDCLVKLKGGGAERHGGGTAAGNVSSVLSSLPEIVRLTAVGVIALFVGLLVGFVAGRVTAPKVVSPAATSPAESNSPVLDAESDADTEADPATRPGYRWVREYTRKDGVKVKGHWVRDSGHRN